MYISCNCQNLIMYKYHVLLLLFVKTSLLIAQQQTTKDVDYLPYYQKVYEAKNKIKAREYIEAFNIYTDLFKKYDPVIGLVAKDYVNYIKSAELSNGCYSRFNVMKKLISEFGYKKTWINDDEVLDSVYQKSGIDDEIYKIFRERYLSSLNKELRYMVIGITKRDQKYRRGYNGNDKLAKMKVADSINFEKLHFIFEKYGYPDASLIGHGALEGKRENVILTFVLRHVNDEQLKNYILPKLKYFIKRGEFLPSFYETIYFSYVHRNRLVSEYEVSDKYDIDQVNKNRYEVGLPPLKKH